VQLVNHRSSDGRQWMGGNALGSLPGVMVGDMNHPSYVMRPEAHSMIQDQAHLSAMSGRGGGGNQMLADLASLPPSSELPG